MGLKPGQELSVGDVVVEVMHGGFSEVAIIEGPLGTRAMKRLRDDVLEVGGQLLAQQFVQECLIWSQQLAQAPYVARALLPIPRLDDLGPVLFMDYIEGGSLQDLLAKQRRFSVSQTRRIGAQIAEALAYAHQRGVVHRDLKPNNVLLNRENEVRLIDWGVSGALGAGGLEALNTYCSPERMADPSLVDASDDIYMLGVILLEGLTGQKPDNRDLSRVLDTMREPAASVPAALVDLLAAMVELAPVDRPGAEDVKSALDEASLRAEVRARDHGNAFCPSCSLVSSRVVARCPMCGTRMRRRKPRAVPPGMTRVPAGVYRRGLTRGQAQRAGAGAGMGMLSEDQLSKLVQEPLETVFVDAFDIDTYPVTNQAFAEFCKATKYPAPDGLATRRERTPDHPVRGLGWKDALCYALWAGKRLPTAREWEKAARGSEDDRSYPWGDEWDRKRCNHGAFVEVNETTPVSRFTSGASDGRSPYGVADMSGNVSEWVSDDAPFGKILKGGHYGESVAIYGLISFEVGGELDLHSHPTGVRCARDIEYDDVPVSED